MKKKIIKLTGNETPEERAAINRQIQKDQHDIDRRSKEKERSKSTKKAVKKSKNKKENNKSKANIAVSEPPKHKLLYSQAQHKVIAMMKAAEMSFMEKKIAAILDKCGVYYRHNHRIKNLYVGGRRKLLFYDFFLPDKMIAIEYDGKQHFEGKDPIDLANRQNNDYIKNVISANRKIKLLRLSSVDIPNMESIIKKFLGLNK